MNLKLQDESFSFLYFYCLILRFKSIVFNFLLILTKYKSELISARSVINLLLFNYAK